MAATHGLVGVFLIGKDVSATHAHTDSKGSKEDNGCYSKMLPLFCLGCDCHLGKEEYAHEHAHIVTHLRVLEETDIGEKHHQQRAPGVILSIYQYHANQHQGHPGNGIGLAVVRGGYDDKEIRRHCHRKGTCHAEPVLNLESAQQKVESDEEIEENKEYISVSPAKHPPYGFQYFINGKSAVCANLVVGHTGEHAARPEAVVTGLLMELMRLLTRGGTIDVVTGVNDFALYSGPIVDG